LQRLNGSVFGAFNVVKTLNATLSRQDPVNVVERLRAALANQMRDFDWSIEKTGSDPWRPMQRSTCQHAK